MVVLLRAARPGQATGNGTGLLNPSFRDRVLYVVLCTLAAIIIALVAGILFYSKGQSLADATLYGGGVFGAALLLLLAVLTALGLLS